MTLSDKFLPMLVKKTLKELAICDTSVTGLFPTKILDGIL